MTKKPETTRNDEGKVAELAYYLERLRLAEYIQLFNQPWRLVWLNFIAGLARGVGIAIGGTLLAAVVLWLVGRVAILNLPIIGDFIADLVYIVQQQLTNR